MKFTITSASKTTNSVLATFRFTKNELLVLHPDYHSNAQSESDNSSPKYLFLSGSFEQGIVIAGVNANNAHMYKTPKTKLVKIDRVKGGTGRVKVSGAAFNLDKSIVDNRYDVNLIAVSKHVNDKNTLSFNKENCVLLGFVNHNSSSSNLVSEDDVDNKELAESVQESKESNENENAEANAEVIDQVEEVENTDNQVEEVKEVEDTVNVVEEIEDAVDTVDAVVENNSVEVVEKEETKDEENNTTQVVEFVKDVIEETTDDKGLIEKEEPFEDLKLTAKEVDLFLESLLVPDEDLQAQYADIAVHVRAVNKFLSQNEDVECNIKYGQISLMLLIK